MQLSEKYIRNKCKMFTKECTENNILFTVAKDGTMIYNTKFNEERGTEIFLKYFPQYDKETKG